MKCLIFFFITLSIYGQEENSSITSPQTYWHWDAVSSQDQICQDSSYLHNAAKDTAFWEKDRKEEFEGTSLEEGNIENTFKFITKHQLNQLGITSTGNIKYSYTKLMPSDPTAGTSWYVLNTKSSVACPAWEGKLAYQAVFCMNGKVLTKTISYNETQSSSTFHFCIEQTI